MISTISNEKIEALFEKALKDYASKEGKGLIPWCVDAGAVSGLMQIIQELTGFPPEKLAEYRLRIEAIGDLHTNEVI